MNSNPAEARDGDDSPQPAPRTAVLTISADGRVVAASPAALALYGYTEAEMLALRFLDLELALGPSLPPGPQATGALDAVGRIYEARHRRKDGTTFPAEVEVCSGGTGTLGPVLAVVRDATDKYQLRSELSLFREIDRRILEHVPLDQLLDFICARVAILFDFPLVCVGVLEPDGAVRVRATGGMEGATDDPDADCWTGESVKAGPLVTAIRTHLPQWFDDLGAEGPGSAPWMQHARARGFRSVLALPLIAEGRTLGGLALHAVAPGAFSEARMASLTAFASQVALSLRAANHQTEIRLLTTALEAAANGVMLTDRQGVICWVNPAFTRLTGFLPEEAIGQTARILRSNKNSPAFYQELWHTILSGRTWHGELENRRKDGSIYMEEQTITPVRGPGLEITHFIAIKLDITERKRQEEKIRYLAQHDSLTGLPNRRMLHEHLERVVARAVRGQIAALLLIDVDDFKLVNDTLGHAAGDQLLMTMAGMLNRNLRLGDLLARLGGDEFAIVLEGVTLEAARTIAERLRHDINGAQFHQPGGSFEIRLSIGLVPIDGRIDVQNIMSLVDAALYCAKNQGKNRVVVLPVDGEREGPIITTGRWATRIRSALQQHTFSLYFQPVIHLESGKPVHHEALLRMHGEGDHMILPDAFLPAAERFGLMAQIDQWVLGKALQELEREPNLQLFINISGSSLGSDEALASASAMVREKAACAARLGIEITETAAITDLIRAQGWMTELRNLGCRFALDDFGKGFSSFAYLRTLPVDYVKIDGSFIRNLAGDHINRALVQAMTSVAHTLGKKVIAEQVEAVEIVALLRELGVELGQGFAWGRPGPELMR